MPAKPIQHGTWQGYKAHIYRRSKGHPEGETCDACREAWRKYCYKNKEEKRNA